MQAWLLEWFVANLTLNANLMTPWLEPIARRAVLWNKRRLRKRHAARQLAYAEWCTLYDTLGGENLAALQQRATGLSKGPAIGLLLHQMPALADGQAMLQSLQGQLYPRWHLGVALAPGDDAQLQRWWQGQAAQDPRVTLHTAPASLNARCQALLDAAIAPWLAFTDGTDRWRAHALLVLAETAMARPDSQLIYADEDVLDADGQRSDPQFKPDWNPDLLLGHNYIGRPALWAAAHLRERRPFSGTEYAAWQHHTALRGTEGLPRAQITHVPQVLCHRNLAALPDAQAATAAVQAHLDRCRIAALAESDAESAGVRVRFALPEPAPWVTIVIPTRNGLGILRQCVQSILQKSSYPAYDIVIVDNGSDDPACLRYLSSVSADARVSVRRDERPFNFAALNNDAVAQARGEFVALVNNDVEVITPGWLEEMVSLASRPGVGAVGARLWYGDGTLQHGGVIIGLGGAAGHAMKWLPRSEPGPGGRAWRLQAYLAVTAACMVVRKSAYLKIGGMDADAFAVAFNDVDFCLKLSAAGLRNLWTPYAELYHHESVSRGSDKDAAKLRRLRTEVAALQLRWQAWIARDPYYSPNLTLTREDFAPAEPPRVTPLKPWFATAEEASY
jgi:O-antigen biosynthesis protein